MLVDLVHLIKQNSFNPKSNNLEILIVWHLRRVAPRAKILLLPEKKADLKDIFKTASKSVCISTVVVSPDPLSPSPSTSSAMKTTNTEEVPDDTEPAGKGESK